MGQPAKQTIGIAYHKQETSNGVIVSVCPVCSAEYPMTRKDWESHMMTPEGIAHYESHSKSTLDALRDAARLLATSEMETDPIPDAIAAHCARQSGKPLTKRDTDALEKAYPGLRCSIRKSYTCSIDWYAHPDRYNKAKDCHEPDPGAIALIASGVPSDYKTAGSIYFDTGGNGNTTNIRWPTVADLKERNARYFSARDKRNAARKEALSTALDGSHANTSHLARLAALIDQVNLMSQEISGSLDTMPAEVTRVTHTMLKMALERMGGSGV